METEARLRLGTCDLLAIGTIAGFAPDAARVEQAFASHRPDAVALGVPPEDLAGLRQLADATAPLDLELLDEADQALQKHLARFGAVMVPSPDLAAAHRLAAAAQVPLEAVDLGDEEHSAAFTRLVKVRHLVQATGRRKKALRATFDTHADPYSLAAAWDAALVGDGPHRDVERERERHMAAGLRALAARHTRVLAVLPLARLAGTVSLLRPQP